MLLGSPGLPGLSTIDSLGVISTSGLSIAMIGRRCPCTLGRSLLGVLIPAALVCGTCLILILAPTSGSFLGACLVHRLGLIADKSGLLFCLGLLLRRLGNGLSHLILFFFLTDLTPAAIGGRVEILGVLPIFPIHFILIHRSVASFFFSKAYRPSLFLIIH